MIRSSNSEKLKILRSSTYRGNLIPKTALLSQKAALRNQIPRGMVEAECINNYTLIKIDSQNRPFGPKSNFTGIKFQEVWLKDSVYT